MWSSKRNENVWDGFMLDYFNPFIIGVAIALILVLWNCIGLGLFSSHKERSKWNQLSEEEKNGIEKVERPLWKCRNGLRKTNNLIANLEPE